MSLLSANEVHRFLFARSGGLEADLATGLFGCLLYAPLLSLFGLLDAIEPPCASMYCSAYLVT